MFNAWLAVSASLVFFMQAGFLALECGLVRDKNVKSVAFKNLIDCILTTLLFCLVGFALMFGKGGLVGLSFFGMEQLPVVPDADEPHLFALFQLGFAATAVTIVSGAIAGRAGFIAYMTIAAAIGMVIYPVFGHWVWGDLLLSKNKPWLSTLGFVDFAGSTVVHSLGGWIGLTAAYFIGPRLGRFDEGAEEFRPSNYGLVALGVMILWFSWFGFNGGSVGKNTALVGPVILHTCLAASAAGLSGYAHAVFAQGARAVPEKLSGATLAGLVAITASCHVVTPLTSVVIGAVAGVLHNLAFAALIKLKIDDAIGVFPVHGAAGIWGTLCVGLFGRSELIPLPRPQQIFVQALGCVVCALWAMGTTLLVLWVVRRTVGLRVSPEEELEGVSVAGEHAFLGSGAASGFGPAAARAEEVLSEEELAQLLQDRE